MSGRETQPALAAPGSASVVLLVGPKFSGKSLFLEEIARTMIGEGISVAGFVQRGVFDEGGTKIGYDMVTLPEMDRLPLARRSASGRGWTFFEEAFAAASETTRPEARVCIMDEIGPVELSGGGHRETLEAALARGRLLVIVVREELVGEIGRLVAANGKVEFMRHSQEAADDNAGRLLAIARGGKPPEQ